MVATFAVLGDALVKRGEGGGDAIERAIGLVSIPESWSGLARKKQGLACYWKENQNGNCVQCSLRLFLSVFCLNGCCDRIDP